MLTGFGKLERSSPYRIVEKTAVTEASEAHSMYPDRGLHPRTPAGDIMWAGVTGICGDSNTVLSPCWVRHNYRTQSGSPKGGRVSEAQHLGVS